jgi:hypothetical protein
MTLRSVLVMEPGRWEAGTRLLSVSLVVGSTFEPFSFPPLPTMPALPPAMRVVCVALRLPAAVLSLPPLAVAPSPPTEVILPALSRVSLLTPFATVLAGGLDFFPLVPVLANLPRPSLL